MRNPWSRARWLSSLFPCVLVGCSLASPDAADTLSSASSAVTVSTEQVRQVYRDTLGREPATWEVDAWVANITQGGWTLNTMHDAFARDPQCRAAITAGYQQILERDPATSEVDFWQQQILSYNTIPAMRDTLVRSPEGVSKIQIAFLTVIHLVAAPEDTATGQRKIAGGLTLATYRTWLTTQLRYDQVYQRSLHNAYETDKHAGVIDQLVYYGVRDIEWDLRSQPPSNACGLDHAPNNDWFTYHLPATGQDGRFYRLSDGLQLLAGYQAAVPEHEIVTLHLELKGGLDGGSCDVAFPNAADNDRFDPTRQTPEGLDALLRAKLGSALLTPAELLSRCPNTTTLQQAVATCGWPLLDGLRGRILVTVHAANIVVPPNHAEDSYNLYAGPNSADATKRVAFLAPLKFINSWPTTPPAFGDLASNPGVVMHTDGSAWATGLLLQQFPHHVVRAPLSNTGAAFVNAAAAQVFSWIQTDAFDFHANPQIRTENALGYPFCPIGVVGANCQLPGHALGNAKERQHLLAIDVRSGDIAGTSDDLAMAASFGVVAGQTNTWTAFISNASNDNVHPWAKGCLMARYQLTPDSPYYAICRAGDDKELFIQYRSFGCNGTCGTAQAFASLGHNMQGEDATFVKLRVWSDGSGGQWTQGFGSVDGASWQGIGSPVHFPQELVLQGIAASSNVPGHSNADGTPTRFLFGNVKRNSVRQVFGFAPVRYRDGGAIRTAEPLATGLTTGNVPLSSFVDRSYFGDL